MKTKKVLILQHDMPYAAIPGNTLRKEGFDVETNWRQSREKWVEYSPEIILSKDPDILLLYTTLASYDDGFDLCKRIRDISNVPIIMFSGKDSEEAIILALELGADDYITQPFSLKELVARVNSLIRRAGMPGYYPD